MAALRSGQDTDDDDDDNDQTYVTNARFYQLGLNWGYSRIS